MELASLINDDKNKFKCKNCSKEFDSEMALRGHMKAHKGKSSNEFRLEDFQKREREVELKDWNNNILLKRNSMLEQENRQLLLENHALEKENSILKVLLCVSWIGFGLYGGYHAYNFILDNPKPKVEYSYSPMVGLLDGVVGGVSKGLRDGLGKKVAGLIA